MVRITFYFTCGSMFVCLTRLDADVTCGHAEWYYFQIVLYINSAEITMQYHDIVLSLCRPSWTRFIPGVLGVWLQSWSRQLHSLFLLQSQHVLSGYVQSPNAHTQIPYLAEIWSSAWGIALPKHKQCLFESTKHSLSQRCRCVANICNILRWLIFFFLHAAVSYGERKSNWSSAYTKATTDTVPWLVLVVLNIR